MSAPVTTFDIELSPVARQLAVAYLHDVDLVAGHEPAVGDRLVLRDEGMAVWDAEVVAIEGLRLGHKYRLHISPRSG
ncbi:hypothetical protein Q9S36_42195 [Microbacterium sp. ARD31]|uniref:hypothetical protein n=1 Tax=Microbacterium sp. ARD31 TaxID=2962576 RepID=UPI002882AF6A|nr:hypothetical protein [Microbacterium sp. ARD31]MDT0186816.1 hypothetical protein [Microbacterium sp. ARD31]